MPLVYRKLAHVTDDVSNGVLSRGDLLAGITAGEIIAVNLKGRYLTSAQVEQHLDGTVDGETVVRA